MLSEGTSGLVNSVHGHKVEWRFPTGPLALNTVRWSLCVLSASLLTVPLTPALTLGQERPHDFGSPCSNTGAHVQGGQRWQDINLSRARKSNCTTVELECAALANNSLSTTKTRDALWDFSNLLHLNTHHPHCALDISGCVH